MNIYATLVCANGRTVTFRQRELGYNRFKILHDELGKAFKEVYPDMIATVKVLLLS